MRHFLVLVLLLAAAPASAASFFSAYRSVRAQIDEGQIPGATDEHALLDQLGDFNDAVEIHVEHDVIGGYSNHAQAEQQSSVGGVSVSFVGFVAGSGTSDDGGPNSTGETKLEVDIVLDESESFTLKGDYEIELGNGEVALEVQLTGSGVYFLSASDEDLFQHDGTLDYAGTIEPGTYKLAIRLFALGHNFEPGLNLGGGSVRLENFILILQPVFVPEPATASMLAVAFAGLAALRRR